EGDNFFVVRGEKPRRWILQTDFGNDEAVGYLPDRLARIGLEDALAEAGATAGAEVVIGDGPDAVVFDWDPDIPAGSQHRRRAPPPLAPGPPRAGAGRQGRRAGPGRCRAPGPASPRPGASWSRWGRPRSRRPTARSTTAASPSWHRCWSRGYGPVGRRCWCP